MKIEKLIEQLQKSADFEDYPVVASFAAIIEKKYLREAATALSTLQAENEKLKDQLYDGEGVNLVNYWMQQAKIEENGHRNCQAENEKLRVEAEGMRSNWYKSVEEIKKLRAELEQVIAERDAAVKDIELIVRRINDCNIKLDDGTTVSSLELGRCLVCKHEETGDCDDGGCIFEWRGPKKEN